MHTVRDPVFLRALFGVVDEHSVAQRVANYSQQIFRRPHLLECPHDLAPVGRVESVLDVEGDYGAIFYRTALPFVPAVASLTVDTTRLIASSVPSES